MPKQQYFRSGRHLAAARTFAGLKQIELAHLARLHVNSLKRLEAMRGIAGSEHACTQLGKALEACGILSKALPIASLEVAPLEGENTFNS